MCANELPFKSLNEILNKPTPTLAKEYQEFNDLLNWFVFHSANFFFDYLFIFFYESILTRTPNERFNIIQVDEKLKNTDYEVGII